MKWILAILSVLTLWHEKVQACDADAILNVLSYNVHRSGWTEFSKYWIFRKADILRIVREVPADIYSFQEMDRDQATDVAAVLPGYRTAQLARNLFVFYRSRDWQTFHNTRWRDSSAMTAGRLILRPGAGSQRPWMEIWSLWIDQEQVEDDRDLAWLMDDILAGGSALPGLLSLSLRTATWLHHDPRALGKVLKRWHLQSAETPASADWQDAFFASENYALSRAQRLTARAAGSYPSPHVPLATAYCLDGQRQLLAGPLAP